MYMSHFHHFRSLLDYQRVGGINVAALKYVDNHLSCVIWGRGLMNLM
jgi:hypothetical protein